MKISLQAVLYSGFKISKANKIEVGSNSVIGHNVTLDGRAGIRIGRNVNISSEVMIWTKQHDHSDPKFKIVGGKVIIEDYVWISARAGTTSIYEYIKELPDIFMTEPKEPTFFPFANEIQPVFTMGRDVGFVTNIKEYLRLYDKSDKEVYFGEASTPYLYLYEKTIVNIKKFVSNHRKIKIIIILRNPIDRAYSQYMVNVRDLSEPLSFEEAIQNEKKESMKTHILIFFILIRACIINK